MQLREFRVWKVIFFSFVVLFLVGGVFASNSRAQITATPDDVTVSISPENPGPFELVTVTVTSFSFDLNRAAITWLHGATVLKSGVGEKSFSFRTDKVGTSSTIKIKIVPNGGATIDKTVTVTPSELDILWEATDSYVPPFYKGKALPGRESRIKVVAMSPTANSKSYAFAWQNSYDPVSATGNAYTFNGSKLKKQEVIGVTATSLNAQASASNSITINKVPAEIVFYQKSPIRGVLYENALQGTITLPGDEMTIVAEPYFVTNIDPQASSLDYQWFINTQKVVTPFPKNELLVSRGENEGEASIGLTIVNTSILFETVKAALKFVL